MGGARRRDRVLVANSVADRFRCRRRSVDVSGSGPRPGEVRPAGSPRSDAIIRRPSPSARGHLTFARLRCVANDQLVRTRFRRPARSTSEQRQSKFDQRRQSRRRTVDLYRPQGGLPAAATYQSAASQGAPLRQSVLSTCRSWRSQAIRRHPDT